MKILMLSWEYPPRVVGGIARVVGELSKKLQEQGHDVTVVTYREGDMKYHEIEESGVEVYGVDNYMINPNNSIDWIMQLNFAMVAKVSELIANGQKFDVIHAHDWLSAYAAKTIKESFKIPLVSTIHATEAGRNSGINTEEQRYINDTEWMLTYESNEVIVNSNFMKNDIQRLFGLPFEKIQVIPNGIDLDKFNGFKRDYDFRRQYARDEEKIILVIGRLVFEKGIQHLICAMPKILDNYHDVKLIVAGKGGMEAELKQLAYDIGVADKVYFTGYLAGDNVQKMYKCADIAVFPSTYEPFGIVALEAMLAGVPAVVSDVGGLNEIIKHGENGLKSYSGNANSIADSVIELLFNHKLSEKMVSNAKTEAITQYNWDRIAELTYNTYNMAIEKNEQEIMAHEKAQVKSEKINKKVKEKEAEKVENKITNLLNFNDRKKLYNL